MTKLEIKELKAKAKELYPTITRSKVDQNTGDVIACYTEIGSTNVKKVRISNSRLVSKPEKYV